jgi:hypothetical protein
VLRAHSLPDRRGSLDSRRATLQRDHHGRQRREHENRRRGDPGHAAASLAGRLQEAGVEVTEEIDHGFIHSIYFTDPNGIALEASYWLADATARPEGDRTAFTDPDPVPAVRELEAGGRLDWMPATDLVPEPRGVS